MRICSLGKKAQLLFLLTGVGTLHDKLETIQALGL